MNQHIPPFAALRALEATARTGRVIDAADDLCITHAAVSHQIRKLEQWFEADLFTRHGDGMQPTLAVTQYARSISHAFGLLADATAKMRASTSPSPVVISSLSFIFETLLFPNIRTFWRDYPEIDVSTICTNSLFSINHDEPEADLAIRVADKKTAHWPGYNSTPLVSCAWVPLCSPSYLEQHGPIDTIEALMSCDLIDDITFQWEKWLEPTELFEKEMKGSKVFTDLTQGVASAMLNEGIILAPKALIGQHLRLGTLVALDWFDVQERNEYYYYLCWKSDNIRQNVEVVRDWLLKTAAQLSLNTGGAHSQEVSD